jgi:hypothetical protein
MIFGWYSGYTQVTLWWYSGGYAWTRLLRWKPLYILTLPGNLHSGVLGDIVAHQSSEQTQFLSSEWTYLRLMQHKITNELVMYEALLLILHPHSFPSSSRMWYQKHSGQSDAINFVMAPSISSTPFHGLQQILNSTHHKSSLATVPIRWFQPVWSCPLIQTQCFCSLQKWTEPKKKKTEDAMMHVC